MKKLNKILLSFVAVFALAILLKLPVDAESIRQISSSSTSLTIQLPVPANATNVGYSWSTSYTTTPPYYPVGYNNSFIIDGQSENINSYIYVYFKYTIGSTTKAYYSHIKVCTNPYTIASSNFGINSASINTKKVSFWVNPNPAANGFELELYKNGVLVSRQSFAGFSSSDIPVSANATYQYRVRYYVKNYSDVPTFYSTNWSTMRKFCLPAFSGKAKSNRKGFTLTLKKASGVKKYLIYVSKISASKGFKKVASVALGSKSKKTISITKNYKKRARNYIKVIPVFADGTKSDIIGTGSIKVYK